MLAPGRGGLIGVALIDVDDVYFHYPRATLGTGDEGWTLKGI